MASLPEDYAAIDAMLEAGDLESAEASLDRIPPSDERYRTLHIKLRLCDGSLPAEVAMQRLIELMRRDAEFPGAKALYQEVSRLAYQNRASSVSHSHPPARPNDGTAVEEHDPEPS